MKLYRKTINDFLKEIHVHEPGEWNNTNGPKGWFAVSTENGIIAYFGKSEDAFFFRLAYINAIMNPIGVNEKRTYTK